MDTDALDTICAGSASRQSSRATVALDSCGCEHHQSTLGLILHGNEVEMVFPGGPAFLAGLLKGDSIVAVEGEHTHWDSPRKKEADLLLRSGIPGSSVQVKCMRDGTDFHACLVRMAVERVESINAWMQVQSQSASHAESKKDPTAIQHSSEMLQLLIQILKEQHVFERMMAERIHQLTDDDNVDRRRHAEALEMPVICLDQLVAMSTSEHKRCQVRIAWRDAELFCISKRERRFLTAIALQCWQTRTTQQGRHSQKSQPATKLLTYNACSAVF